MKKIEYAFTAGGALLGVIIGAQVMGSTDIVTGAISGAWGALIAGGAFKAVKTLKNR